MSDEDNKFLVKILIFIFLIEMLLIIPWLPFAGLSAMAYDSGKIWPAVLLVGPFHAYPIFILISILLSIVFYKLKKIQLALTIAIVLPFVSGTWLFWAALVMQIYGTTSKGA